MKGSAKYNLIKCSLKDYEYQINLEFGEQNMRILNRQVILEELVKE